MNGEAMTWQAWLGVAVGLVALFAQAVTVTWYMARLATRMEALKERFKEGIDRLEKTMSTLSQDVKSGIALIHQNRVDHAALGERVKSLESDRDRDR